MKIAMRVPAAFRRIEPSPAGPPTLFHGAAVDGHGRAAAVLTVTAQPLPEAYRTSADPVAGLVGAMGSAPRGGAGARDLRRLDLPGGPAVMRIEVETHTAGAVATMTAALPDPDERELLAVVLAVPGARDWAGWCGIMTRMLRGVRFG